MPYDHDYVCMMKQPVLCELCNKSYAIGVMKKHKQSKMHIENAKNHGVPSSSPPKTPFRSYSATTFKHS